MHFVRFVLPVFIGFCVFSPWRNARALTQAEVTSAMVQALKDFAEYSSGSDDTFLTWPMADSDGELFERYLSSAGGVPIGIRLDDLLVNAYWPYITLIGSYSNQLVRISSDLYNCASNLLAFKLAFESYADTVGDYLYGISSDTSSIDKDVGSIRSDTESLNLTVIGISGLVQHADSDLHDLKESASDLYSMLDSIYLEISSLAQNIQSSQARDETFIGWATNEFLNELSNLQLNIPDPLPVELINPEDIEHEFEWWLDDTHSDLHDIRSYVGNTELKLSDFYRDWRRDYLPFATNFFAAAFPTTQQTLEAAFITNSVVTNAVYQDHEDYQTYSNELEKVEDADLDFSDYVTENPHDVAETAVRGFERVKTALEVDNPSFTTEVVIMGSDERPHGSAGRPDLEVRLPRIAFNVDSLFSRFPAGASVRNIMTALWRIVGVFLKLFIAKNFLKWYSERKKT